MMMQRNGLKKRVMALAFMVVTSAHASGDGSSEGVVAISHSWVRLVPPVSTMSAGYMVLHNSGSQDDVLLGAESTTSSKTAA